jgi:hypothetical protein
VKIFLPILLPVFLAGLFASCSNKTWADSVITNTSASEEVTFKFTHTGEITLPAGASTSFETVAYQRMEYYRPEKRVSFSYDATDDGYTAEFRDRDSWPVKVNNTLAETATLSADGWMENAAGQMDIEILAGGGIVSGLNIYTKNPKFTVTTATYPAVAVYEIKPDPADGDTETVFVTIKP